MRDPERIGRILELVRKAWEAQPDLRFGQLIENTMDTMDGLFYVEDDVTEEAFRKELERIVERGQHGK